MTADRLQISGDPGPSVAAAVTAVVAQLLAEEQEALAHPVAPPRHSAWVLAGRPRRDVRPHPGEGAGGSPWSAPNPPRPTPSPF